MPTSIERGSNRQEANKSESKPNRPVDALRDAAKDNETKIKNLEATAEMLSKDPEMANDVKVIQAEISKEKAGLQQVQEKIVGETAKEDIAADAKIPDSLKQVLQSRIDRGARFDEGLLSDEQMPGGVIMDLKGDTARVRPEGDQVWAGELASAIKPELGPLTDQINARVETMKDLRSIEEKFNVRKLPEDLRANYAKEAATTSPDDFPKLVQRYQAEANNRYNQLAADHAGDTHKFSRLMKEAKANPAYQAAKESIEKISGRADEEIQKLRKQGEDTAPESKAA